MHRALLTCSVLSSSRWTRRAAQQVAPGFLLVTAALEIKSAPKGDTVGSPSGVAAAYQGIDLWYRVC